MQDKKLADWAVAGAKVWVQMDSYSSIPQYRAATITRVTKTSAFVKLDGGSAEYRFTGVEEHYISWAERDKGNRGETWMNEYGSRGDIYGWRGRKHLYAGDSKIVAANKARGDRAELERKARNAATQFAAGRLTDKSRYAEGKLAIAAIEAWLAVVPEDEQ